MGTLIAKQVGTWDTVRVLVHAWGATGVVAKPSPKKTMIIPVPENEGFVEIEWLSCVSPSSGSRLFEARMSSVY